MSVSPFASENQMRQQAAEAWKISVNSTPLLTRPQVAEILSVSVRTVDELIHTGDLPVVRLGGKSVRFRPAAVQLFIEASESRRNPRTASRKTAKKITSTQ